MSCKFTRDHLLYRLSLPPVIGTLETYNKEDYFIFNLIANLRGPINTKNN